MAPAPREQDVADARRQSPTHDRAVLRQDNGELQEDVVAKETLDAAETGAVGAAPEYDADEQSEESFPASDPPSSWAGGGASAEHPRHGDVSDRLVERAPVEHPAERDDPDDPVPGTLPKH